MRKIHLLIIDPQNDFCHEKGTLYVPGAQEDMARLAEMIRKMDQRLDAIHVTLDTHHFVDIAHPIYWKNAQGQHPQPFTTILAQDVESGTWQPTDPTFKQRALDYVQALEANHRYQLVIWPYHCLLGSWGHNIESQLFDALMAWERKFQTVDYHLKGFNIHTEHYSAVQADVPDPDDPSTLLNRRLIDILQQADCVAVAGEALNFCVANTVRDIVNHSGPELIKKLVLLSDATSPVPGEPFEALTNEFIGEMRRRGLTISTTVDFVSL